MKRMEMREEDQKRKVTEASEVAEAKRHSLAAKAASPQKSRAQSMPMKTAHRPWLFYSRCARKLLARRSLCYKTCYASLPALALHGPRSVNIMTPALHGSRSVNIRLRQGQTILNSR